MTRMILMVHPDDPDGAIIIPLQIVGVASAFTVRTPIQEEFDDENIPHLVMTGESPDWEPYKMDWAKQETALTNCRGHIQKVKH